MPEEKLNTATGKPEKPTTSIIDIFTKANDPSQSLQVKPTTGVESNLDFKSFKENLGQEFELNKGQDNLLKQFQKNIASAEYDEAKKLADDQGFIFGGDGLNPFKGELATMTANLAGNIGAGTGKWLGYIGDLQATFNFLTGQEADYNNWLSDYFQSSQDSVNETFKVHQNPDGSGGWLQNSRQWLMGEFIPQLGDQAAMQLATMVTTGGLGNIANIAGKTMGLTNVLTPRAKFITRGIGQAFLSRDIESKAEAASIYNEEYEKLINTVDPDTGQPFTPDEAKKYANEAATFVYRTNWLNVIQDIPEQMMLLRGFRLNKAIDDVKVAQAAGLTRGTAIKNKIIQRGSIMGSEAFEEADQFIITEEGKHLADVQAGIKKDSAFSERLGEYLNDANLWEAAGMGALSAGVMQSLTPRVRNFVAKRMSPEYMTEREERIEEIQSRTTRMASNFDLMKKAKESNDEAGYKMAENKMVVDLATRAARVGNLDIAVSEFEKFKNLSTEQLQGLNLDENIKQRIPEIVDNIKWAAKQYQYNTSRYSPNTVEPILYRQMAIKQFGEDLPKVKQSISEIKSNIPRVNDLSIAGKEILDLNINISGLTAAARLFEKQIKITSDKTEIANRKTILEDINKLIDVKANQVKELTKSEFYKDEDNSILRSIPQPDIEELATLDAKQVSMNKMIEAYGQEINLLTDRKTQSEAYKNYQEGIKRKPVVQVTEESTIDPEIVREQNINNEQVLKSNPNTTTKKTNDFVSLESEDTLENIANPDDFIMDLNDIPDIDLEEFIDTPVSNETNKNALNNIEESGDSRSEDIATANNDSEGFTPIKEEEGKLKTIMSAAWLSARNPRATDNEQNDLNKARTEFLESNIDLSKYEVRLSVDREYMALAKGEKYDNLRKDITKETIGNLPIRATFYEAGNPVEYAEQPMFVYLKESDYWGFQSDIKDIAKQQLDDIRARVLEAETNGQILATKVVSKSSGYFPTDEGTYVVHNVTEVLQQDSKDIELSVSQNKRYVGPEGVIDTLSKYDAKSSGVLYATAYDTNNNPVPMRLFTSSLSIDEQNLVYNLYNQLLLGSKYTDSINKEIISNIKDSTNPVISGIAEYLNLDITSYSELINTIVWQNKSDEKSKFPLRLENNTLVLGDTSFTKEEFIRNEKEVKFRLGNLTRQINKSRLNDSKYKTYLIDNNIVYTNVNINSLPTIPTPLVQPLISFSDELIVVEGQNIIVESISFETINTIVDTQSNSLDVKEEIKEDLTKTKKLSDQLTDEDRKNFDGLFRMESPIIIPYTIESLEEELEWFKTNLPQVPIDVVKDLINVNTKGDKAYGMFFNSMVTVSSEGAKGTVYHEAFHAVFNLMLNSEERQSILDETNMTEENLSEVFREYKESGFNPFDNKSKTTNWFNRLLNMITSIFNRKLSVNKLFNRINNGYYSNKLINIISSNVPSYRRKVDGFTEQELASVSSALIYVMFNSRNNKDIRNINDINADAARKFLIYKIEQSENNNDLDVVKRYQKVLNAFTKQDGDQVDYDSDLYKALEETLHTYGIINKNKPKTTPIKDIDDSEVDEVAQEELETRGLDIKPSYELSDRENATASTKLLLASVPSVREFTTTEEGKLSYEYNLDPFLGIPVMENFNDIWNKVKQITSDIVPIEIDGKLQDGFSIMIDRMKEESTYFPSLKWLANKLETEDEQIQTQFYFTFSGTNINYISTFLEKDTLNEGKFIVKIGSPDVQSIEQQLRNEWDEIFKDIFTTEKNNGIYINEGPINEVISMYESTYKSLPKSGNLTVTDINNVVDLLSTTGIQMTYNGLRRAIDYAVGNSPAERLRNIFTSPEYSLGSLYTTTFKSLKGKNLTEKGFVENILQDQKAVLYLAENQSYLNASYGQNTILMAEGNQYSVYSKHNLITRKMSEWKQNPELLKTHRNKFVYNQNSLWLDEMINSDGSVNMNKLNKFKAVFYGHFKEEGASNDGFALSDLTEKDEMVDRINRILSGTFVNLAKADKSTDIHFQGPKVRNTKLRRDIDGWRMYNKQEVNDIFLGYILDELNRISLVKNNLKTLDSKDQIIYYHYKSKPGDGKGNGLNMYLFPSLSFNKGNNYGLYLEDGTPITQTLESLRNNTELIKHIESTFLNEVERTIGKWIQMGIISSNNENINIGTNILSKYSKTTTEQNAITEALGDYVLNGIIGSVEMTKLFTGDPALYKEKNGKLFEDFAKRVPATIASGSDSRILEDLPSTYKSAVISNIDKYKSEYASPENIKAYAELLKENDPIDNRKSSTEYLSLAEKTLSAYKEVNQTDAQAYITLDGYKNRMRMWGKWSTYHEKVFRAIKKFEDNSTEENRRYAMELALKHKLGFQPLKTVHVEEMEHFGTLSMQYNKQSEAVLNPLYTIGTPLDKVRKAMESKGVEHVVVLDGKKVGAIGITQIANPETGEIFDDINFNPVSLSYTRLSLQQDLPFKGWKDTLLGSQVKKNILTNVRLDKTYTLDGKTISGEDLIQELFDVESAISNIGKQQILEELGYNEESGLIDRNKVRELLRKGITERPVTYNAIDALDLGLPLESMSNFRKRMQNGLMAAINKDTVKVKTFGGSFIQMSDFGFADLDLDIQSGVIWLTDKQRLKPPRLIQENNRLKVLPGQVLLPYNAIKDISGYKDMTNEELLSKIDKRLLKGLAYRIPNQNTSSNDIIEIVGILPPIAGDTMIAYTEITTKTGSDFDIDKQYVSFPAYEIVDGELKYIDNDSKEGLDNKRLKIYESILTDPKTFTSLIMPLDDDSLKNDLVSLFPETQFSDLQWFTPDNQMTIKRQFQGGKFGVGQTANMLTDHPLAQLAKMYLNQDYLGKGNINELGLTTFDGITDEDGKLISNNIAMFLNAYVDIAKDPFIERGNHNTITANTVFMLARVGVSLKWINRFIGQPILKDYVMFKQLEDAATYVPEYLDGKKVKALDKVRMQYGIEDIEISDNDLNNLNSKDLEDNIKGLLVDNSELNARILNTFVYLQGIAKEFNGQLLASKADVGNNKTLIGARIMENNRQKAINIGLIGNFENKFENTMLGTYHENGVLLPLQLFKNTFFSETEKFLNTTEYILGEIGKNGLFDEEMGNMIAEEAYAYLMSSSEAKYKVTENKMKGLFFDKNSMAIRLNKLKYSTDNSIKDRTLIKYLTAKKGRGQDPDFVGVSKTKQTPVDIQDMIYRDWENMLTDENSVLKEFANDLISYAYYGSGFRNNLFSFFEYIPSSWIADSGSADFINKSLDEFNIDGSVMNEFVNQFFRNNINNNTLVPKVSGKAMRPISQWKGIGTNLGFIISDDSYIIGLNEDGLEEYRRFVKVESKGKTILYKLKGYNINKNGKREGIYTIAPSLGYNKKGRVIKEYYFDQSNPMSSLPTNKVNHSPETLSNLKTFLDSDILDKNIKPVDFGNAKDKSNEDTATDGLTEICSI